MPPPVRFFCKRCSLMMKVGSKMFGRIVVCPQCGERLEVPFESDPKAEELYRFMKQKRAGEKAPPPQAATTQTEAPSPAEQTDFEHLEPDEVDRWIDEFWATVSESDAAAPIRVPHPLRSAGREEPGSVAQSLDHASIVFATGKTWFFFNVLLVIVFLLGGGGGFLLHGLLVGFPEKENPADIVTALPVSVEGQLHYRTPEGFQVPDADAVLLFLPWERVPTITISSIGLRPNDNDSESGAAAQTIEELGGVYRRTGADGSFAFSLPGEGRYLVLAISSHLRRPVPEPDAAALRDLQRFFRDPTNLLEDYCFVHEEYDLKRGTTILRFTFSPP